MRTPALVPFFVLVLVAACGGDPPPSPTAPTTPVAPTTSDTRAVDAKSAADAAPAADAKPAAAATDLSGTWCDKAVETVDECKGRGKSLLTLTQTGDSLTATLCYEADGTNGASGPVGAKVCTTTPPGALKDGAVSLSLRLGKDKNRAGTCVLKPNADGTLGFEWANADGTEKYGRKYRRVSSATTR
jgi:hypothetical protein